MPGRDPRAARPVLTGRALVLGVLVVLLIIVLAAPINRYLGSRSDANQAATQLSHDRAQLARLKAAKARYADPGYIQQQARTRLQFAMPGDTVYVVVDHGQHSDIERTRAKATTRTTSGPAWNNRLWNSIRGADG